MESARFAKVHSVRAGGANPRQSRRSGTDAVSSRSMDLKSRIRSALAALQTRAISSGFDREAAVLMPVFEEDGEPHFLLTLRTEEVETHKGQISFPGGMRDGDESLEITALRETWEEIGIEEGKIEILGRFHDYVSSTDYHVVPFVGYVRSPFQVVPQPTEVAEVLTVPFRAFFDPERLRTEKMMLRGKLIDVHFYSYNSYQIWGLTARIIKDFLAVLMGGQSPVSPVA
jgi:8-oxo-dGTP pyrophosphatase MutT (NUDIX family)